MILGAFFYGKLKDDYEYDKIWQYKMHEYIPFRVAPLLNCVEVIMINLKKSKTKRIFAAVIITKRCFTGILILILIVAMVVPMVAYLIP